MVCYPTLGGSGILATELGHELAKRGHKIHFITYEIPFRLRLEEENIYFHEVEISQYDLFKYPDYALTLAVKISDIAQQYDLDLVHVHYAIPHATSAFLAKQICRKKLCVITTLHGTDITLVGRNPSYFQVIKFSIEHSDGVTAVSESLKEQTCCQFGIHKPIKVIYNFFIPKPSFIGKKPMRHLFASGEEKLLLHSSNYRDVKRPEDVVLIFERIRSQLPAKLIFLGTGNKLERVRSLVEERGLTKDVIFIGKSREVDPYIASADLFLLPSSQESFGLAALEAMAYGVPVIATKAGGLPELIEDGVSGFLSPIGDIEDMAQNAVKLLVDPHLYQMFSQAAQRRAEEYFSADKIVPLYEKYYRDQLAQCNHCP